MIYNFRNDSNFRQSPESFSTCFNLTPYKMNNKNRGKCIIINHEKYDKHMRCPERIGTDKDVRKLKKCMKKYGFDVLPFNDLPLNKIEENINKG